MKKTVDVNIAGIAYKLDEDAFEAFNKYLNDISSRLAESDREEVLEDVEARVAELLNKQVLLSSREVVSLTMIQTIISQIGSPEAFGEQKRPTTVPHNARPGMSPVVKLILICMGLLFAAPIIGVLLVFFFVIASIFASIGMALAVPGILFLFLLGVVGIPVYALIHTLVCFIRDRKVPGAKFWVIVLLLWLLSLGGTMWVYKNSDISFNEIEAAFNRLEDMDDMVDYDEYIQQEAEGALPPDSCVYE